MRNTPLIDVIIPVYNGSRYIDDAIKSVLKQQYDSLEIIIVDDGSTDDTPSVVRSFKDIRYIRQENHGVAAARNRGIENSGGELIAFLDADDCWAPGKLTIQVECLINHPDIGYTLGKQINFLEPGTVKPFWLREEHLLKEHTGFIPTLLIRREIFKKVGLFNTSFRTSEDVEWFSRVKNAGIPMMVVPEVVLYRRIHNANLSYHSKAGNPLLRALRTSVRHKNAKEAISPDGGSPEKERGNEWT
jgi:glycosyltransferase involved in cell wall biosynthesis